MRCKFHVFCEKNLSVKMSIKKKMSLKTPTTLKLVSAIFYQIFVFPQNDSPSKTMKCFLFHQKSSFRSQDIHTFVIFSLPFHTFQIKKVKWK